jgi:hypothetical protein
MRSLHGATGKPDEIVPQVALLPGGSVVLEPPENVCG